MELLIDGTRTVGSLAADHPEFIPIFDRLGIDYCCHGSRSLAHACEHAGVHTESTIAQLAAARPVSAMVDSTDWRRASMSDLADHIEKTHHVLVADLFDRLESVLPRVVQSHAPHHPWLLELAGVVSSLRHEMLDHMQREERVLFPWLRALEEGSVYDSQPHASVIRPIEGMVHDHVEVSLALTRIRQLTSGYAVPKDACGSFAVVIDLLHRLDSDTRVHIHKENNILFPAGVAAEAARLAGGRPASCSCHGSTPTCGSGTPRRGDRT